MLNINIWFLILVPELFLAAYDSILLNNLMHSAAELISHLQVKVNGEFVKTEAQKHVYFALNKPNGYVCTSNKDSPEVQNKRIVIDLFQDWMTRWQKRQSGVSCC